MNRQPVKRGGTVYHSCHISGNNICFGKEQSKAFELLGQMELKKLAHFLYLYLKTYNPEDTYLSMNYWINGKENGGVVNEDALHLGQAYCNECDTWVRNENFDGEEGMCNNCSDGED